MKRILVPVDFSVTSEKAFRFAAMLAVRTKATIISYHIFKPERSSLLVSEKIRKLRNEAQETFLLKKLQRFTKKILKDYPEQKVSIIVGHAPVVDNILGFAEDNHIDLIVMGTQGVSGLKKALVGSVASHVIEESDIPVILIPQNYELTTHRKIVFTTNYHPADKKAISIIIDLAKLLDLQILVLHLFNVYSMNPEEEKELFNSYTYALQKTYPDIPFQFQLLETAAAVDTLSHLEEEIPFDFIALVRRKKTFFQQFFLESFTSDMAHVTHFPLLIVPETDEETN
jgi:nucleotide-binding universal stress UspA family protein